MTEMLDRAVFNIDVSKATPVQWFFHCRTTVAKDMELTDKFVSTDECRIQVDEAKVSGSAKYRKGRRIAGDAPDYDNDEDEAVQLDVWEVSDDKDKEGEEDNMDFVRFSIDDANWK